MQDQDGLILIRPAMGRCDSAARSAVRRGHAPTAPYPGGRERPAQRIGPGVERWGGRREGARLRPSVDDGAPIRHYAPVFGSETTKGRPLRALHGHPLTQPPTFAIVLLSGHLLASWMRRAAVIVGD